MASFEEAFKTYQNSGRGQTVSGMYDAQKNAGLSSLKSAYESNLADAQAARSNIDKTYRANANDLASQYERIRRNNNIQAAASGLNTGTASQMNLAQGSAFQRDYGNLMGQYAQSAADSDLGMAKLTVEYQNAIRQANADGDYKKMAALLDDYNTQYNTQLQQAQALANYGDFSAYYNIPGYSEEQINNMRSTWIAQNPLLAYNTGAITAQEYQRMTGKAAPGANSGNTWSSYRSSSTQKKATEEKTNGTPATSILDNIAKVKHTPVATVPISPMGNNGVGRVPINYVTPSLA